MQFLFNQVDVFSSKSCLGNPVCVFIESENLTPGDMKKIARWTNLSETTFVTKSDIADYKVRIFTPSEELPFAGHPTLGTAFALLESGIIRGSSFIQDCAYGLIPISKKDSCIFFELLKFEIISKIKDGDISEILSISCNDSLLIDTGPHWIISKLDEVAQLDQIRINTEYFKRLNNANNSNQATGITVYACDAQNRIHVRTFFEAGGIIVEDPVCGSGNAAVAAHIKETGLVNKIGTSYTAFQGRHVHRQGEVFVDLADKIKVGGRCNIVFTGNANYVPV